MRGMTILSRGDTFVVLLSLHVNGSNIVNSPVMLIDDDVICNFTHSHLIFPWVNLYKMLEQ